jgi:CRISPR-associated protein Csc1
MSRNAQANLAGSLQKLPPQVQVRAFKGIMELMSELFFASLEPGDNYTTEPIILNTALYYALGYAKGNYINRPLKKIKGSAKQNPDYIEDTEELFKRVYVTPAKLINFAELSTEIYNSRSDDYVQANKPTDADSNANIPRYGVRKQIQPGARFLFYVLTFDGTEPDMPPYIRLGKKRCKALVEWSEVEVSVLNGTYTTTHPILAEDTNLIPLGDISFKRMQPFDIIKKSRFSGDYLKIESNEILPFEVRFLRRIRN